MRVDSPFPVLPRKTTDAGAAYVEAGTGEPVILVHGVGLRSECYAGQLTRLSREARVLAVDMPGHGASARIGENATIADYVAWFGRFIDDLGLDTVSFAGHSMGAMIAAGMAATYPGRIRRVALLSGCARRTEERRAATLVRAAVIRTGSVDNEPVLKRWYGDTYPEATRLTRGWLASVDKVGYATAYAAFAAGDTFYCDAWPRIACPALFMTGELDAGSTPADSNKMAAAAQDGEAVIVAGHGHMIVLTAADMVDEQLSRWLRRN